MNYPLPLGACAEGQIAIFSFENFIHYSSIIKIGQMNNE